MLQKLTHEELAVLEKIWPKWKYQLLLLILEVKEKKGRGRSPNPQRASPKEKPERCKK